LNAGGTDAVQPIELLEAPIVTTPKSKLFKADMTLEVTLLS
jgi:hypothetical protein